MKKFRLWLVSSALLTALAQTSLAACPADGAKPMKIGPHSTQTTFPLWVQDSEGLALEICPATDLNCLSAPILTAGDFAANDALADQKAALSARIGFGDEGFWASASALITLPGGQAELTSAVEAAFLPDFADGNQVPFTRLRLRIDIPQTGLYVVTHPWGQISYNITAPGGRAINDSFDIPFAADEVGYQGRIGPILTWDTFPDDALLGGGAYIGTLAVDRPVKGSPCGTNYFRIDGPDIGGTGIDFIQTNLFTVTGKVYTGGALPTPLEIGQVTYSRAASGRVSVFAEAPTQAVVSFSGGADLPAGPIPMTGDGSGRFFGSVTLAPGATTLPAEVTITASNAAVGASPADVIAPLVDLVTITRAEFDYSSGDLNIEAHSSDEFAPPTLSALGQDLTNGVLLSEGLIVAPPTVTVSSSAGGSATIPVTVIHTPEA